MFVLFVFPHQGFFDREAPEQKSFDFSISRPDDDSNAKKAASLSRDLIKTRDKDIKTYPAGDWFRVQGEFVFVGQRAGE